MKLPDFLEWSSLTSLRNRMGASRLGDLRLTVDPNRLTEAELERLVHGGLDVSSIDDVRVLADGTLAYKDSRVLIYIRDVSQYKTARGGEGVRSLPRFHLANCDTLQMMRREKRYERYVVAARQDGFFEVNFIENNRPIRSSAEKLRVCQNCLGLLAFDGFQREMSREQREAKVSGFSLKSFFTAFPRALLLATPSHRSDSAPLDVYPEDFTELARKTKEARGWRCEAIGCGVDLSSPAHQKFLHAHHVNGQKYDSRPENLALRCIGCHADEPLHSHMKVMPEYREYLRVRPTLLNMRLAISAVAEPLVQEHLESKFSDATIRSFAARNRLKVEDYREKNGALWVKDCAPGSLAEKQLLRWGFRFKQGRGWWYS